MARQSGRCGPAQARLVALAPELAPVSLSLNSSAIYLGSATGAAVGALVIAHASVGRLGWRRVSAWLHYSRCWALAKATNHQFQHLEREVAIGVTETAIFIANTLLEQLGGGQVRLRRRESSAADVGS